DLADDAEVRELRLEDAGAREQRGLVERLCGPDRLIEQPERRQPVDVVPEELLLGLGAPPPRAGGLRLRLGLADDRRRDVDGGRAFLDRIVQQDGPAVPWSRRPWRASAAHTAKPRRHETRAGRGESPGEPG